MGNVEVVNLLLERGVDPAIKVRCPAVGLFGGTALHALAVGYRQIAEVETAQILDLFIERGISLEVTDLRNLTPLDLACKHAVKIQDQGMVNMLTEIGVNASQKKTQGAADFAEAMANRQSQNDGAKTRARFARSSLKSTLRERESMVKQVAIAATALGEPVPATATSAPRPKRARLG
jgi:hypothetical protein